MTTTNSGALDTALAYHRTWTSHDFQQAMTYIADDIVCDAPSGRIEGAEAFRCFMGPFVELLLDSTLLAAYGDDRTAALIYDTATKPVASAPGAECLTVEDGRIIHMRIIFDQAPFEAAERARTAANRPGGGSGASISGYGK